MFDAMRSKLTRFFGKWVRLLTHDVFNWFITSSRDTDVVSNSSNDFNVLDEKVEKYSVFQPTPISIAHFIEFGRTASPESSYAFLKREVPVRYFIKHLSLKWILIMRYRQSSISVAVSSSPRAYIEFDIEIWVAT